MHYLTIFTFIKVIAEVEPVPVPRPPQNIPAAPAPAPGPQEQVRALLLQCLPQRVRIDD